MKRGMNLTNPTRRRPAFCLVAVPRLDFKAFPVPDPVPVAQASRHPSFLILEEESSPIYHGGRVVRFTQGKPRRKACQRAKDAKGTLESLPGGLLLLVVG